MVDVSICMVSLNCWNVLEDCLNSVAQLDTSVTHEIIIVDNASTDDTTTMIERTFPHVRLIRNDRNVGFTKGTNQAIEESSGRFILWLNTDTILEQTSIRNLVDFLNTHPKAGIAGPKILNADGSFQPQCRRGLPTPSAALAYLTRQHRLWPTAAWANGYLMTHINVDSDARVAAVSGACLMARRAVWDDIGPLDERIFGFGEDIDWCVRAANYGWEVWYYPGSQIVHLKGQGGAHSKPFHKIVGIHQAMWIFYSKHLQERNSRPVRMLVRLGIGVSLSASLTKTSIALGLRRLFR